MKIFIEPPFDREQHLIFRETLDQSISQDHPVRIIDQILDAADLSGLYVKYAGGGRPAYPPLPIVKLLVYGYAMGFRSSRQLEYMCTNNLDFMWLMRGMKPDHDTIADFRKTNENEFKELFKWTVKVCRQAGLVTMERVAVDATRVESNNGRNASMTQTEIEESLSRLEEHINRMLKEAEEADKIEDTLFGKGVSPSDLSKDLKDAQKRKEKLTKALEKVKVKEERGRRKSDSEKRVPVTDPDSDVMRDKKGAFAPNYSPWIAVDGEFRFAVSCGVTSSHSDSVTLVPAIEEAEANTGLPAVQVQADSAYATEENLVYCEERGIEPCIAENHTSPDKRKKEDDKPWPEDVPGEAVREDGTVVKGKKLPRTQKGKFDKSAFTYDPEQDAYICPMGRKLKKSHAFKPKHKKQDIAMYACVNCRNCAFRKVCCGSSRPRSVGRASSEDAHMRHKNRMSEARMKADYKLRKQTVEPAIAIIKSAMGVRKFLQRGIDPVSGEWDLINAAFNLRKLMKNPGLAAAFMAAL